LEATGWKIAGETGAAQLLGMNPSTLASRMKALGLSGHDNHSAPHIIFLLLGVLLRILG